MPLGIGKTGRVFYTNGVPTSSPRLPVTATLGTGFPIFRTPTEFRPGRSFRTLFPSAEAGTTLWFNSWISGFPGQAFVPHANPGLKGETPLVLKTTDQSLKALD